MPDLRRGQLQTLVHLVFLAVHAGLGVVGQSTDGDIARTLGLVRRQDDKWAEFVDQHHAGDGNSNRRRWSTVGPCAPELVVTDVAGQIVYEAADTRGGVPIAVPRECSWRVRPGYYIDGEGSTSFIKDMSGPITLTMTAFALSPYESVEVWSPDAQELQSTETVRKLDTYAAQRHEIFATETATTAIDVAPDSSLTADLVRTAIAARAKADSAAVEVGLPTTSALFTAQAEASGTSASASVSAAEEEFEEAAEEAAAAAAAAEAAAAAARAASGAGGGRTSAYRSADGRSMALLARFPGGGHRGNEPPPAVTTTAAELVLVYRCTPPYANASEAWSAVRGAVARADLTAAVRVVVGAAAFHIRGFYRAPICRLLHTLAKRMIDGTDDGAAAAGEAASRAPFHREWLVRQLFRAPGAAAAEETLGGAGQPGAGDTTGSGDGGTMSGGGDAAPSSGGSAAFMDAHARAFEAQCDEAVTRVAQQDRRWQLRGRHDEIAAHGQWADRYTPRRYPVAFRKGEPTAPPPAAGLRGLALLRAQSFYGETVGSEQYGSTRAAAPTAEGVGGSNGVPGASPSAAPSHTTATGASHAYRARALRQSGGQAEASSLDTLWTIGKMEPDPPKDALAAAPRFVANFTAAVDCSAILPYGTSQFPPETVTGTLRNYKSLPFPLQMSPCQGCALCVACTSAMRCTRYAHMWLSQESL